MPLFLLRKEWYKSSEKLWYHNYSTTRTKHYYGAIVGALRIVGNLPKADYLPQRYQKKTYQMMCKHKAKDDAAALCGDM